MSTFTAVRPVAVPPVSALSALGPNWFASVMGTGIVAVAAATLPVDVPALRTVATVCWLLAVGLLVTLTAATALRWYRFPVAARAHLTDPVMAHFHGAPVMGALTVGAGTLLVGTDLVGPRWAVGIDLVLWTVGTVAGLVGAVMIPWLLLSRRRLTVAGAFGGWLMSVVPPMVSASTGALLVPHLPSRLQVPMLVAGYGMVAFSLVASVVVLGVLGYRLVVHPAGPAAMVPTLWIVLGPLGQSVTAVNLLAGAAIPVLPTATASALMTVAVDYGCVVLGAAGLWALYATAVTLRTARHGGLQFTLTWWSFTFPVGTCVTGASGMARHTGSPVYLTLAVVLFAVLVAAWSVVAVRTVAGCRCGSLFGPVASPVVQACALP